MAGQLTLSTLNDSSGVLATQNGMSGIAKAWVRFHGGTSVINSSFNVSSITKISTGQYGANFTTAMPNTSYVCLSSAGNDSTNFYLNYAIANTTSQAYVSVYQGGFLDASNVQLAVFR